MTVYSMDEFIGLTGMAPMGYRTAEALGCAVAYRRLADRNGWRARARVKYAAASQNWVVFRDIARKYVWVGRKA